MKVFEIEIPDEQIEKVIARLKESESKVPEEILTTNEASKFLGISAQTLLKYCKKGFIEYIKKEGIQTNLFLKSEIIKIDTTKLKYQ